MDRLVSEQQVLDILPKYRLEESTIAEEVKAIPSAYKGMTNGQVITKILKDAEWAELTSDFGLAQEDTIYIKVGSYWWNNPYEPQESEDKE